VVLKLMMFVACTRDMFRERVPAFLPLAKRAAGCAHCAHWGRLRVPLYSLDSRWHWRVETVEQAKCSAEGRRMNGRKHGGRPTARSAPSTAPDVAPRPAHSRWRAQHTQSHRPPPGRTGDAAAGRRAPTNAHAVSGVDCRGHLHTGQSVWNWVSICILSAIRSWNMSAVW
jgi:hypothetical protein